jgi:hypothetical protein
MPDPLPLQPTHDAYTHASSSSSAPQLQSHTSSDSSIYAHSSSGYQPQTPSMSHSHSDSPSRYLAHSHSHQSQSSTHAREAGTPIVEKRDPFATYSPHQQSPYSNNAGYWAPDVHGGDIPYGGDVSGLGYGGTGDGSHQFPHVHESLPRAPSSSDLRVVYPALSG